jgi:hypothetical protein
MAGSGAIAYGALLFGGVRATELAVMTGLVGTAAVFWIVRLWVVFKPSAVVASGAAAAAGVIGFAVWRAVGADVAYAARQELWMVVLYGLTFVIGLHNLHGQDTLQRVTTALVGLGTGAVAVRGGAVPEPERCGPLAGAGRPSTSAGRGQRS